MRAPENWPAQTLIRPDSVVLARRDPCGIGALDILPGIPSEFASTYLGANVPDDSDLSRGHLDNSPHWQSRRWYSEPTAPPR